MNPWVTPTTMLLTSERVRPCRERFSRSSSWRSASAMLTPSGTGMGALPIRDIRRSPHETEHLAAHAAPARFAVGEESLTGGQDGDAEASEDAGNLVGLRVDAEA